MGFEWLDKLNEKGYKGEKIVTQDYEPLEGTYTCKLNRAEIKTIEKEGSPANGQTVADFEAEVVGHASKSGRRAWKTFWLDSDRTKESGKNEGKTDAQILLDWVATAGLQAKSAGELATALENMKEQVYTCYLFHYTTQNSDKPKQSFSIQGVSNQSLEDIEVNDSGAVDSANIPF